MRNTGVAEPSDFRQYANPIITGTAAATPSTASAWKRSRPSSKDEDSKLLVSAGAIQRSACAWSIMVVIVRSNPMNSPSCTATRTIEKTMPTTVAMKRTRS